MSQEVKNVDRPSLHWDKKYLNKVEAISSKNIEFNSNPNKKIYSKFNGFFQLKFSYFLPIFGYFYSLVGIFCCYGRIKSSSIFNLDLYKYFKRKIIIIWFIYFLFGPILFLVISFFSPLFAGTITLTQLLNAWAGIFTMADGIKNFGTTIIVPYFNSNIWWIALLVQCGASMINVSVIFSSWIINVVNDNVLKIYLAEDNFKMKISRFVREKKGV
ncbi:hypothetical protein [Malacoplasma iowae]|uniref:hypothetical protein n=1 Tax=Malacoplasma iowae TaxID=2116 RepID=UPI002A18A8AB|nr:hypothetical protein [Malacoplasma iowae]WPL37054.1 hypothetical protein QX179_01070 [Malacoplasma iowae]WPL38234.1 hypothetical protein QX182_01800 [Malacoplasma iowae]WPL39166.1 hypothetical protein QX181_01385 [Malacoplasma iowae]WPL39751.1 hypothetical protein QX183_04335 [Malacoplasma iowae]